MLPLRVVIALHPREVDGRFLRRIEGAGQRTLLPLPLASRPVSRHLQAGLELVTNAGDIDVARAAPRADLQHQRALLLLREELNGRSRRASC